MYRIFFLLILFSSVHCIANPERLVRDTFKHLSHELSTIPADSLEATVKIIKNKLEPNLDMERISKVVLASNWKRASLEQKNRFIQCFTRQLVHHQAESFQQWQSGEWEIQSTTYNDSGSKAAVKVQLTKQDTSMEIIMRLYKSQEHWYIYDASLNGISLLKQFRDDFSIKIERHGLGKTLARLCQQYPLEIKTLYMAANEWPPFIGRSIPGRGLSVELVSQVFKLAGYQVEMTFTPWRKVSEGLSEGKFDLSVAAWKNKNRQKTLLFSEPYFHNQLVVITTDKNVDTLAEFQRRLSQDKQSVGIMQDYAYGELIPKNSQTVSHKKYTPLLRKLAGKKLDMALSDLNVAQYYLNSHANLKTHLKISKQPIYSRSLHISMLKKHPVAHKVISDFNRALKVFQASKANKKLHAKYKLNSNSN